MKKASQRLVTSAIIIIVITVAGKILGFGREVLIAYLFGASAQTDAYLIAITVPVLLFAGIAKAVKNVYIPIYDKYSLEHKQRPLLFQFSLIGLLLTTVIFILPAVFFPQYVIKLFASGFTGESLELASNILQVFIFVLWFKFLSSVFGAVLHVNKNFIVPSAAQLPYNIFVVGCGLLLYERAGIYGLVIGTFLGVATQTIIKLPWVIKTRPLGDLLANCRGGLYQIFSLLPPVILSGMAGQIKHIVDKNFASFLPEGSISYLHFSNKLVGLPHGIVIAGIVTVIYPSIVSYANLDSMHKYKALILKSIKSMQFLLMPIMVGFIVLAHPILTFVYQWGSFGETDVLQTVLPLRFYSLGLLPTMITVVLNRAFYALRDTKTPLYAAFLMVGSNVFLNALLVSSLKHSGLALATAISMWLGAIFKVCLLQRKISGFETKETLIDLARVTLASVVMGAICYLVYYFLQPCFGAQGFLGKGAILGGVILLGAVVYMALSFLLKTGGAAETRDIFQSIISRLRGR